MREIASKGQLRLAYLRWAVVTVPLILLLGFASARLAPSGDQNSWYLRLAKPSFMPPSIAFPIVWSILYVLLGLALAVVINARGSRLRGPAIALFAAQMVLNLIWTPLFFGMHQVLGALVVILALFVAALATAWVFGRVRAGAGLLLVPYLIWIAFAGFLLYRIHQLNPNAATLVPSSVHDQIVL